MEEHMMVDVEEGGGGGVDIGGYGYDTFKIK